MDENLTLLPEENEEFEPDITDEIVSEVLPVEIVSDASEDEVKPSGGETPSPEKKEDSKIKLFFRKLLRWTAGILIVFGLGLITGIFVLYRPATKDADRAIKRSESERQMANENIAALEGQISNLETEVSHLQTYKQINEELVADQRDYELHIAVLDARLDVTNATLALSKANNAQAQIILEKTSGTLATIGDLLEEEQRGAVENMKQRLELVLGEMEADAYAAQSDLDVLATNLLQLEDALFTE